MPGRWTVHVQNVEACELLLDNRQNMLFPASWIDVAKATDPFSGKFAKALSDRGNKIAGGI